MHDYGSWAGTVVIGSAVCQLHGTNASCGMWSSLLRLHSVTPAGMMSFITFFPNNRYHIWAVHMHKLQGLTHLPWQQHPPPPHHQPPSSWLAAATCKVTHTSQHHRCARRTATSGGTLIRLLTSRHSYSLTPDSPASCFMCQPAKHM